MRPVPPSSPARRASPVVVPTGPLDKQAQPSRHNQQKWQMNVVFEIHRGGILCSYLVHKNGKTEAQGNNVMAKLFPLWQDVGLLGVDVDMVEEEGGGEAQQQ